MTTVRQCELVTNLQHEGTTILTPEQIQDIISQHKCILEFSFIVHDQDTYTPAEEKENPEHTAGTLKPAHVHILLKFKQPQHVDAVAKWFGLAPNFVNKINGSWEDACLYQIHYNTPEKHQYETSEVNASFDYDDFLFNMTEALAGGVKKKSGERAIVDGFVNQILNGEIPEYSKTLVIPHMLLVKYARTFDQAFKIYSEHLQATRKERRTEVIYITGKSGSGKTTLAKRIADERGLQYFLSSGSNDIMDGYAQEPVLIVDDIRPSVLGLSDLLKMLDPHTATSVKSRYKNKYLNADLVILTTVLSIEKFYNNVFAEHDEPITQLKRRCQTLIKMDFENIWVSVWDTKTMNYTLPVAYKNTVIDKYINEVPKSPEDVKQHVNELMPFLKPDEDQDNDFFAMKKVCDTQASSSKAASGLPPISDEEFKTLMPDRVSADPEGGEQ